MVRNTLYVCHDVTGPATRTARLLRGWTMRGWILTHSPEEDHFSSTPRRDFEDVGKACVSVLHEVQDSTNGPPSETLVIHYIAAILSRKTEMRLRPGEGA